MQKVKNAIIIHGPGRSGTTLISNIFSLHPSLSWISGYVNRFPKYPALAYLNRIMSLHGIEAFSRGRKLFPRPTEPYGFWLHYFPRFNHRSGSKGTIRDSAVQLCIQNMEKITKWGGGQRFVTKLTGVSRYEYIREVFDNPFVIWIDRQPQSVVMSFFKQQWFYKSRKEVFNRKKKTELIDQYFAFYEQIYSEKELLKEFRFMEIRYEDFVKEPVKMIQDLMDFCELMPAPQFLSKTVASWKIKSGTNDAYKQDLEAGELAYLDTLVKPYCEKLAYGTA